MLYRRTKSLQPCYADKRLCLRYKILKSVDDVWNAIRGVKRGKSDANGRLSSDHFIFACKAV